MCSSVWRSKGFGSAMHGVARIALVYPRSGLTLTQLLGGGWDTRRTSSIRYAFMPFSQKDVETALIRCGRHCCLCHKFCGTNIELHHIVPESKGGLDVLDNAIPLCFDCHAEVEHYNPLHPRGRKFTESELKGHRDQWYAKVASSGGTTVSREHTEMDRILFSRIREMLSSNGDTVSFLRDTDLGISFELELLKGLHEFVWSCKSPDFEFMDSELESQRASMSEAAEKFLVAVAQSTFPCQGLPRRNEIPPEWRDSDTDTQRRRYQDARTSLNELASEVYAKYENLIRAGRRRLAIS